MQLWRRVRNEAGESQLIQVEAEKRAYDAARRRVVVLPGADVFDIHPQFMDSKEMFDGKMRDLAGCIKGAEILLGGEGVTELDDVPGVEGIDIFSYTHGMDPRFYDQRPTDQIYAHYKDPDNAKSNESDSFVRDIMFPLLNEDGSKRSLEKIPAQELCERLDHITFVNHSRGGLFMRLVNNSFRDSLSSQGYSEQEIAEIMPHMLGINVASIARIDEVEKPSATMFHFLASNDETACRVICKYGKVLSEREQQGEQRDHMMRTGADPDIRPERIEQDTEALKAQCGYQGQATRTKVRPLTNGMLVKAELPDSLQWTECLQDHCELKFVDRALSREHDGMHVDHNFRLHSIPGKQNPEYPRMLRNTVIGAVLRDGLVECGTQTQGGDCVKLLTTQQNSLVRPPLVDYREHEQMPTATREALRAIARDAAVDIAKE